MDKKAAKISIEQMHKNLLVLWLAMFSAQFMFLLVIYFVEPKLFEFDLSKPLLDQNSLIIIIFAVFAVINIAASFILRKKFLNEAVEKQNIFLVQTALVVGCALCEAVTLFGFMLAFVAEYQYFFLWMILGALGMLFHFPLKKHLINANFQKPEYK
ncbi:MAG: hypothetical protein HKN25_06155 [Pyrinomonadaceae bacterium]|nr:hypothetical protein [Pyrinomonadaceae bacterium]